MTTLLYDVCPISRGRKNILELCSTSADIVQRRSIACFSHKTHNVLIKQTQLRFRGLVLSC